MKKLSVKNNLGSLFLLIKKNLRLLFRARASALIIFLAPLLIILVLGLSFNTSKPFGLKIGIYSSSFGEDVNSFAVLLEQEKFTVVRYESSMESCLEDVKSGTMHACIELPSGLRIEDNAQKEIIFHIDPSRINLVWMIQETVKSKFNLKAQEISQEMAANILSKLASAKSNVGEKKDDLILIIGKINSAGGAAQSTKNSLASLDTSISVATYNSTALAALDENIDDSGNKINNAISAVDAADATDEQKAEIKALLDEAKDELDSAQAMIAGNGSDSISSLISGLQTELQSANDKLSMAASAINTAASNLDSLSASVVETKSSLEELQSALAKLHDELAAQRITEAQIIASPFISRINKVSREGTYLDYLFPALLVLVIMFSSLMFGTTLVMIEKNNPAYLRNFFLPIRKITFVASIYLTTMIVTFIEIIIILGISVFFLKDEFAVLPLVALILLLAGSVFALLGMAIGYIFTSEETGILASISIGSILLFLSGVIFPLEGVSAALRSIAYYNPFVIAEKIVREIFIFHIPFREMLSDVGILAGYAVIIFLAILIIESIFHEHLVHRFLKHHHHAYRQSDKKNKNEA